MGGVLTVRGVRHVLVWNLASELEPPSILKSKSLCLQLSWPLELGRLESAATDGG